MTALKRTDCLLQHCEELLSLSHGITVYADRVLLHMICNRALHKGGC